MPTGKSKTGKSALRHVAPFAPLALALLMSQAVLPNRAGEEAPATGILEAQKCDGDIEDFRDCHERFPTGCTLAGKYDAYVNLLKNQLTDPSSAEPVAFLTLDGFVAKDTGAPDGLAKNNHFDFKDELGKMGEGQTFAAVGFLYYAKMSGSESSNCQLTGDEDGSNVDFHIGIGFDKDVAKQLREHTGKKPNLKTLEQSSVIVEMTPQYRANFDAGIWTIDNVKQAVGRQVRIVGQLLLDSEHFVGGQDCALAATAKERTSCWRASAWELHPVVRFQVCSKSTNDCAKEDSKDWLELDNL